jgi:hypothetical protein
MERRQALKPASALSRIARFALTQHLQCGKVVPRRLSRRLFSRDSAGRGGAAEELTVAVGSLVVVGTPIADSEYFVRLGERFRRTVEWAFHGLSFHHGTETERDLELGWQEDQLLQLTQAREQGYRLLGKDVQQSVRERVRRPERLREYPLDKKSVGPVGPACGVAPR